MTMQQTHSPKPEIFGEGYGKHIAKNYRLMKQFFWLGWKMMVHMFIPQAFYESAHWEVIDLYHKFRGYRHGTHSDHRCAECGGELFSIDEVHCRSAELKDIERERNRTEKCDRALDEIDISPEKYQWSLIPEDEKAEILHRIAEVESGEVEGIDWRELDEKSKLLDK